MLERGLHHAVAHPVPEDDDVVGPAVVGVVEAREGVGEGHGDCVHDLLTLLLHGNGRVVSVKERSVIFRIHFNKILLDLPAHVVVQRGDNAGDGSGPPALVVEDIDADHHDVLEGRLAGPQLAAKLAVQLQGDLHKYRTSNVHFSAFKHLPHLLCHGLNLLVTGDGLENDDLTGNGLLDAAQLLDAGVPV